MSAEATPRRMPRVIAVASGKGGVGKTSTSVNLAAAMVNAGHRTLLLDTDLVPIGLGWRLAFGLGGVLGLAIMLVRRHVPESPRWLFIHGREEEAERLVDGIERAIGEETGRELEEPGESITVRQRRTIPFRRIAEVAIKLYPRRAVLGFALFVGQAFLYPSLMALTVNRVDERERPAALSSFTMFFDVGTIAGGLALGAVAELFGKRSAFAGGIVLAAIGVWLLLTRVTSPQSAASHLPVMVIFICCGWPATSVAMFALPL